MKRLLSPFPQDSKTLQCITKFQLIPPNLVTHDNPIFSAFSKKQFRKHLSSDPHGNNRSEQFVNQLKTNEDNNRSLLLTRERRQTHMLEGLLKSRKSHIKKIKLKEFYIQEIDDLQKDEQATNDSSQVKIQSNHSSKVPSQLTTLESKTLEPQKKVSFLLPARKKLLPSKLRAKSYTNMPRNLKDRSLEFINDENSLYVKVKQHQLRNRQEEKKLTIEHTQNQPKSEHINKRRKLRSQKIAQMHETHKSKNNRALEDISSRINEFPANFLEENCLKPQIQKHKIKIQKHHIRNFSKLDVHFDINPWNDHFNQDEKENDFFA